MANRYKNDPPSTVQGAHNRKRSINGSRGRIVYSVAETREHEAFIMSAVLKSFSFSQILRACRERFHIGQHRVEKLRARIYQRWAREDEETRASRKAVHVRSIEEDMRQLRIDMQDRAAAGERPDHALAVRRHNLLLKYHSLLADIQGTREPLAIDVNVTHTAQIVTVMANLTPEQVEHHLRKQHELVRLADLARRLMPASSTIGTAAE